jgi:hypothetical protein
MFLLYLLTVLLLGVDMSVAPVAYHWSDLYNPVYEDVSAGENFCESYILCNHMVEFLLTCRLLNWLARNLILFTGVPTDSFVSV